MREVRKIAPNLELHELGNSRDFRFQLRFAKEQAEDILLNLDNLPRIQLTRSRCGRGTSAWIVRRTLCSLTRKINGNGQSTGSGVPKALANTFQSARAFRRIKYPLYASQKKEKWGAIDLLGIGMDFLPVPNELKKREPVESPLRMLVEVAAYGFAI